MPPQLVDATRLLGDLATQLAGHYALRQAAAPSASAVTATPR
jgi:hypothetical protein